MVNQQLLTKIVQRKNAALEMSNHREKLLARIKELVGSQKETLDQAYQSGANWRNMLMPLADEIIKAELIELGQRRVYVLRVVQQILTQWYPTEDDKKVPEKPNLLSHLSSWLVGTRKPT